MTYSADRVKRDLHLYAKDVSKAVGRPVAAVFALELHKSGWWHVHGLMAFVGFQGSQEQLSGMTRELVAATQAWYRRHGYAQVKLIETEKDALAIAEYCAKYMTKDFSDLVFCGRLGEGKSRPQELPARTVLVQGPDGIATLRRL